MGEVSAYQVGRSSETDEGNRDTLTRDEAFEVAGSRDASSAADLTKAVCPVCAEDLDFVDSGKSVAFVDTVYCVSCATPHHRECWNYLGWCATYGCGCRLCTSLRSPSAIADQSLVGGRPLRGTTSPGKGSRRVYDDFNFTVLGMVQRREPEVQELPERPVTKYDDRFHRRVLRNLERILGTWIRPGLPWFDTHSSPSRTMVGFIVLPLWFFLYAFILFSTLPIAFFWAVIVEIYLYATNQQDDLWFQFNTNALPLGNSQQRGTAIQQGDATQPVSAQHPVGAEQHPIGAVQHPIGAMLPPRERRTSVPVAAGYLRTDGPVRIPGANILDVAFSSPKVGIALVDGFTFYQKTVDGGFTWEATSGPFGTQPRVITFLEDGSIGWMAGTGGRLARSIDGGLTWRALVNEDNENEEHCCHGLYTEAGWANDPSHTFDHLAIEFVDLCFLNERIGYALIRHGVDRVYLARTDTGGERWAAVSRDGQEAAQSAGYPLCLSFIDENLGWVGDMSGRVFRTDDGGAHWKQESWYLPESVVSLWIGSSGLGVAISPSGHCWIRAKNDWVETENLIGYKGWMVRSINDCDGERLVAGCSRGLLFLRWSGVE